MEKNKLSIGVMDKNRTRAVSRRRNISAKSSFAEPANTVMCLQKMSGNQAVQQWAKSGVLQAKLTIGPANDIYEQEADEVAEKIMKSGARSQEPEVRRESDIIQMKAG